MLKTFEVQKTDIKYIPPKIKFINPSSDSCNSADIPCKIEYL